MPEGNLLPIPLSCSLQGGQPDPFPRTTRSTITNSFRTAELIPCVFVVRVICLMFIILSQINKLHLWSSIKSVNNILLKRMATPEVLERFESRAATAEMLIESLKIEIAEVKQISSDQRNKVNLEHLQSENSALKTEIEKWKNRLVQLELQNGIKQVALPGNNVPTLVPSAPSPVATNTTAPVEESKGEKKKKDKPATEKKVKSGGAAASASDEPPIDVGRLDFRVGLIVTAQKHPDADTLYVEDVDIGEEKRRTVVSGLVKHITLEEMQNRLVVLLCNLKPSKMRGVTSEAMVMCASTPEKVEILVPPAGSQPGDLVHVEGFPRVPDTVLNPKKKIFETVAPDLKTNAERVATYKGVAWVVPGKGTVTAPSLVEVAIK